ncbi:MAG: response regulator transcription factor [Balneolaceae bacterium]|nr:response regulator transcription factor [Balneolaceae bacterium]
MVHVKTDLQATTMGKVHVLVAESFDIYKHGLESILNSSNKVQLENVCRSGKELIKHFKKNPAAVCLVSSGIPDMNIHDLMTELEKAAEEPPVIVLTHSTELTHLNQSLKAGVKGYLTKNAPEEELIDAIIEVNQGRQAFGKSASQMMIGKYADSAKKTAGKGKKLITKREKEIVKLIVQGYTSAEIANLLFISPRTVETHRSNLMNKLNLKNTAALVRFAMEENID